MTNQKENITMFLQLVPCDTPNIIMPEPFISLKTKILPERDENEKEEGRERENDKEKEK